MNMPYIHSLLPEIHECNEGLDNCAQICTNTIGSFTCGCTGGYTLDDDGFTCNGMQKLYIVHINTHVCM